MSIEQEKKNLTEELEDAKSDIAKIEKRLAKLNKVQDVFEKEPEVGTVLKFSRSLAGGNTNYTFIAYRAGFQTSSWYLTGAKNALQLLSLTERGNSWEDVLVAIGESDVLVASSWTTPGKPAYSYYTGSTSTNLYRVEQSPLDSVEMWHRTRGWIPRSFMRGLNLERNPGSFRRVSKEYADRVQSSFSYSSRVDEKLF